MTTVSQVIAEDFSEGFEDSFHQAAEGGLAFDNSAAKVPPLMAIEDFCERSRISLADFDKFLKRGKIHVIKHGEATFVHPTELERWIYRMVQPALFSEEELAG